MQATTFNYANNTTANNAITTLSLVQKEAIQKIVMFSAILTCLVAAINL